MIEINDLTKTFGDSVVLNNLSLNVDRAKFWGFLDRTGLENQQQ